MIKTKITGFSSLTGQIFSLPNNKQPRTAAYVPRKYREFPMAQFSTSDLTAVKVECPVGKGKYMALIIASVYLPSDAATLPPTREMEVLVDHCLNQRVELILGCDSNSHHLSWGSKDINARDGFTKVECKFDREEKAKYQSSRFACGDAAEDIHWQNRERKIW
ncbi:uncharacterized protein [Leptinotarsa decemlineata]|uniref:uncharacterized protein n=1 Tax=Leptinotarsa decemlineata TaxID=7539 RepID=UPI003D304FF0